MDDEKTLRDRITERLIERWPEESRPSVDSRFASPSVEDLAPLYESVESATRRLSMHSAWIDGTRDEMAKLRREVDAMRRPPPRWRTVAADALDSLAAMLRGSW